MARHLSDATAAELADLDEMLVTWLTKHNIAGSIGHHYSLYRAIETEIDNARDAAKEVREDAASAILQIVHEYKPRVQ